MTIQLGLLPGIEVKEGVLAIREMKPGKARTEAVEQLAKQAENWVKENSYQGIYIRGNVASSKNSKEIGTYKKYDENRVLQKHTILRDSAITERYRITTKPQWVDNRHKFKKLSEGLKWPLSLEFTFIRDSMRKFDFVNAAQILLDLMPKYEYIPDDESCYVVPVFNPTVYYSQRYAGVVIKVINGNEIKPAF